MKFFKGLHTDNHPSGQPESTYRDARNIVLNEERGVVTNEPGNEITSLLPEGYFPIGRVILPDDRIVIFSASVDGSSEIGIIQQSGRYETLVNDDRLNFSLSHPIQAVARLGLKRTTSQQYSETLETEIDEDAIVISETLTLTIA